MTSTPMELHPRQPNEIGHTELLAAQTRLNSRATQRLLGCGTGPLMSVQRCAQRLTALSEGGGDKREVAGPGGVVQGPGLGAGDEPVDTHQPGLYLRGRPEDVAADRPGAPHLAV